MPSAIITCPSGLTGEIRSFKFKELRAFADNGRRNLSRALTDMLQACWLRTDDPAVYGDKFTWGKALYADRLYAWIQARILGFGADIDFEFQCDSESCRERNPGMQSWGSHLNALPLQMLPEASKAAFLAGNRFETTVVGKAVAFRLLTGDLESQIEDRQRGKKRNEAESVAELLIQVEGVGTVYRDLVDWVDDLDAGDLARLGQVFTDATCGVDLGVEVQCEHCRRVIKVDIPFVENFTKLAKKRGVPSV
jgi:hypothetical protein